MATNTYVALDKVTVSGTSTTSVVLSGISSSYTDLRLVIHSQNQNSTYQPYIQFNTDTGTGTTNYATNSVYGNGTNALSARHTNNIGWYPAPGPGIGTTGNFQPWTIDILNYSNTNFYKTGLSRFNNAASVISGSTHLWRSNAAITTITITAESGSGYIVAGSTFSLYGIRAEGVSPAAKATGGVIYSDSTYYYHAFGATGTFTPLQSLTADVLCIAGGGGGGHTVGGGGGAGGIFYATSQSLTATGYAVTVGAGGATGASEQRGVSGTDSQFGSLTLAKGGGGGGAYASGQETGANGGSGGGSGNNNLPSVNGGSSTQTSTGGVGYGNAGGNNVGGIFQKGGGGGGAGVAGSNSTSTLGGPGGNGLNTWSTWASATGTGADNGYYAGGGGGGGTSGSTTIGGLGGGGVGAATSTNNASAGRIFTGSGGGGGPNGASIAGAAGGSGLVIVRYAKV